MSKRLLVVLLLVLVLVGWATADEQDEIALGQKVDGKILSLYDQVADPKVADRISRIGAALVKQSERPDMAYTFRALEIKEVTAFASAGGYVYISKPLYDACQSDDELAAILGHEIAHSSLGHVMKARLEARKAKRNLLVLLGDLFTDGDASAVAGLRMLKHNREREKEADQHAYQYMEKAGFDAIGIVGVLYYLLNTEEAGTSIEFLSTHPDTDKRYDKYQALVAAPRLDKAKANLGLPASPRYRLRVELTGSQKAFMEGCTSLVEACCRKILGNAVELANPEQQDVQGNFRGAVSLKLTVVCAEQPKGSLNIACVLSIWDPMASSSMQRGVACRWVGIQETDLDKRISDSVCSAVDELLIGKLPRCDALLVVRQREISSKRHDLVVLAAGEEVTFFGPYYITRDGKVTGRGSFAGKTFAVDDGTVMAGDVLIIRP